MYLFSLQVNGPITGRLISEGGGGAYKRQFTVFVRLKTKGILLVMPSGDENLHMTLAKENATFSS